MRVTSRVMAAVVLALIGALVVPSASTPLAAQPASPAVKLGIASFDPWSDPSRPLRFTVAVTNIGSRPIEEPVIRTSIYRRVLSRSALHAALDGRRLRNVVATTTDDIAGPIPPGATARHEVTHELTALANVFRSGQGGVYPIEITVLGSDRELASGVTALIFFGETPEPRLNVALVLPVHRPAMFDPTDGAFVDTALARNLGDNGYVSGTATLLAAVARTPMTIAPSGLLLDQLEDLADGYRRKSDQTTAEDEFALAAAKALADLRVAASSDAVELATATYAAADLVPLVQAGLLADATRQIVLGRSAIERSMGRAPSTETFVPAGLRMDGKTAEAIEPLGIDRMVVAPDVLPPQSGIFGPDHPLRARGPAGHDYPVLLADEATASRLLEPGDTDSRLVAQGVLAETAMAWFERPRFAPQRALVLAPPALPHPAIMHPLVTALATAPWLKMRTVSDMIAALPPPEEPEPLAVGSPVSRSLESAVRGAQVMIETVEQVVAVPGVATNDLHRLVLAAQSHDWAEQPARAESFAAAARTRARSVLDKIAVVPPDPKRVRENPSLRNAYRKVTLTSRTGPLPVTVQNDTGYPISIRVRVSSGKVSFTRDVAALDEMGPRETVTFSAAARASGLSPVRVELLSCRPAGGDAGCAEGEGGRIIGTGTVLVQSTTVSAVALAATGGGAAFLMMAWFRRGMRRRRRNGPHRPSLDPGDPGRGKDSGSADAGPGQPGGGAGS